MNVIVIVVDTLRYDHIGFHGNDWIETPNLDRLAAQSWVFDRSFSASFPTIPHRTDAMTGRYGAPFHAWMPLRYDVPTLPWTLAGNGYATQLIHDTPHLVNGGHHFDWPFHAWTFVRGAEVDRDWITDKLVWPENWQPDAVWDFVEADPKDRPMLRSYARANRNRKRDEDWNAARLFRTAAQWLADNRRREKFFLWVDCFDPHEPWDVPPDYAKMYAEDPSYDGCIDPRGFVFGRDNVLTAPAKKRLQAWYAGKVSWVDRWLGEVLDALERTGLSKNTALILTADHGTNVGEWGRFGKKSPVREHETHTPFILRVPGGGSGRSSVFVQPQDIFATVLGVTGGELPPEVDSHDVLALAQRGETGPREFALAGRSISSVRRDVPEWGGRDDSGIFTLLADEHYLEIAVKPEYDRLVKYGTFRDVAADHADVVQELHKAGLDELERRGADPRLMDWVRAEGKTPFPKECRFFDGWPAPAGYYAYFQRLCED